MTDGRPLSRRRRGLTLASLIIALSLLAAFAVVSTQLLRTTWRVTADVARATERAAAFDSAMHRLRLDVAGARQLRADGASAALRQGDGSTAVWRADGNTGTLVRAVEAAGDAATRPAESTQWQAMPAGLTFSADGPTLRVGVPTPGGPTQQITMASQLLLAGRSQ